MLLILKIFLHISIIRKQEKRNVNVRRRKMEVTVVDATSAPLELISYAAGTCYGRQDKYSAKRVLTCIKNGHTSVVEHAHIVYSIDGISRSCLAQLTRHRHISLSVQSQRYCKIDESAGDEWYVVPPSIGNDPVKLNAYREDMKRQLAYYRDIMETGNLAEDARFVLPEATKTSLVLSMNARELQSILKLRLSGNAQWEIRALAENMAESARHVSDEWRTLIDWLLEY